MKFQGIDMGKEKSVSVKSVWKKQNKFVKTKDGWIKYTLDGVWIEQPDSTEKQT